MAKRGTETTAVLITLGFMTFGVWHEREVAKRGTETTAVLITLGFMTFGVLHERNSGIGGRTVRRFLKRESSKVTTIAGYPLK